jgi:hypothetical protein
MDVLEITTKQLRQYAGHYIAAASDGQKIRVSLRGNARAMLTPDEPVADASWDEIMAEVRAARARARKEKKPLIEPPVLAERKRRAYASYLR